MEVPRVIWKSKRTKRRNASRDDSRPNCRRARRPEQLETRRLMAADPIHVGVVYLETDYLESDSDVGSDSTGDRFILSFTGGAPDTELSELRINTDKDGDGITIGDPIFDTKTGGRGKNGFHDFEIVGVQSAEGRQIDAAAEVIDGGQELVIRLDNFRAGDRLEFTLDVDEVLRNAADLDLFNDRLDVITSGQEFQDSILAASFTAPHFETADADALFLNDFGSPKQSHGLDLPPDEGNSVDSRPNRSAAAIASTTQIPKPVAIEGSVWLDDDLDHTRDAGEQALQGVEISLYRWSDQLQDYEDTGHRTTTDATGRYRFAKSLGLRPGTYRVVESQPDGFFSVAAVAGQVNGESVGTALSDDVLSDISIPLGDLTATEYNFAEAAPAELSGFVYQDDNDNGRRDPGESGIGGIRVQLRALETIAPQESLIATTSADGSYSFLGLPPGLYEVVELDQPQGLDDGRDSAGQVGGRTVGNAQNPGDRIRDVRLGGGDSGVEYNFGELARGSLSGFVYRAAPGEECHATLVPGSDVPLSGVEVMLQTDDGQLVAQTTTAADGSYRFEGISKGEYRIVERTPEGLIDGAASPGRIGNVTVGLANGGGMIEQIVLAAGATGVLYNFCELAPAELSGYVYHDQSNDGRRDAGENAIEGVDVDLLDAEGNVVATTRTDASGQYRFSDLAPGQYSVVQHQPAGFLDGKDAVGTVDGIRSGRLGSDDDSIRDITLRQGTSGSEFNFGELTAARLSGRVHADTDGDCILDPNEELLRDVTVRLLNSEGVEIARTKTDASGRYRFDQIPPGNYTVVEETPAGFFEGSARPGSQGGVAVGSNRISQIMLTSGAVAVDYDFCERPAASITGVVFSDRDDDCEWDPDEVGIAAVQVELYDSNGKRVASTTTDADGHYRFDDLPAGSYTIREIQPAGWIHGGQTAGSHGGDDGVADEISAVPVGWGERLTQYNFCELEAASVSGLVYVDRDGDCTRDDDEAPLANVRIDLYDANGRLVALTVSDANGAYQFDGLRPGDYQIFEHQPDGYFQGGQTLGNGGGVVLAVDRLGVSLRSGDLLTDYNFCELAPAELHGRVWTDIDGDGNFDGNEQPLANVTVELIDQVGTVAGVTRTDSQGTYRFVGLAPGTYTVREIQPDGLFHGGQFVGTAGGQIVQQDVIAEIQLGSGEFGERYDFPEVPPATISGYVFQDGGTLRLDKAPDPASLREYRDGKFTSDDTPLGGVVLELRRDSGLPATGEQSLPGVYSDGPIRIVTNAQGYYEFSGLRPGVYHVYQVQPDGFLDGIDTAGSTGGLALNPADPIDSPQDRALIQRLDRDGTDPGNDAILRIEVAAGAASEHNLFSEIKIERPVMPPEVAPGTPAVPLAPYPQAPPPARKLVNVVNVGVNIQPLPVYVDEWAVSWHLSLINGGYPRGVSTRDNLLLPANFRQPQSNWDSTNLSQGRWYITTEAEEDISAARLEFGHADAIALIGDFNGDGADEAVLYVSGNWYVDLNGNGVWDEGDLWIQLGTRLDLPVVGDWDGDGKDDVGIFGRQWQRDPMRIRRDPGLPDPENRRRRRLDPQQLVQAAQDVRGEDRERWLRRGRNGDLRADAVDHVFQYGQHADLPLAGDWNGDGIDQIAVFREGKWLLDLDGDGRHRGDDEPIEFGRASDQPVVGDINGDGIDEIGVVRGDLWIIDTDGDRRLTANDLHVRVPRPSADSQPVIADFDGDGKDEPGYYDADAA